MNIHNMGNKQTNPNIKLIDEMEKDANRSILDNKMREKENDICLQLVDLCDPNYVDEKGFSLFKHACTYNREDIGLLLLEKGCDPNYICDDRSHFMYACHNSHYKSMGVLLDMKCDYDWTDSWGESALVFAIDKSDAKLVRALIKAGCNINLDVQEIHSCTILGGALEISNKISMMLINAGCVITVQDLAYGIKYRLDKITLEMFKSYYKSKQLSYEQIWLFYMRAQKAELFEVSMWLKRMLELSNL